MIASWAGAAGRAHAASLILHHTSFDGGLYWTCPIANLKIGNQLQINIRLYHETKYDSFENSIYSQWKILGLETYIIREGEDKVTWCSPIGDIVNFRTNPFTGTMSNECDGCHLTIEADNSYIVTDKQNRKWFYQRGELKKAYFEDGNDLLFESKNGLIAEIKRGDIIILQTMQTDTMLKLLTDDREIASIKFDASGRLIESIAFGKSNRPPLRFTYDKGNLTTITEGNNPIRQFSWKKVSLLDSWFSLIRYPDYLNSDGYYKYRHKFYLGIAHLLSINPQGQTDEKILNIKAGLIIDKQQQLTKK